MATNCFQLRSHEKREDLIVVAKDFTSNFAIGERKEEAKSRMPSMQAKRFTI